MNAYWKGIVLGLVVLSAPVMAQEKPAVWDLKSCINYARAHNIQIRQSRIAWEESLENTKQAKADRLPSLSFTTAHNYVNRPRPEAGDKNSYSGSYNLNKEGQYTITYRYTDGSGITSQDVSVSVQVYVNPVSLTAK